MQQTHMQQTPTLKQETAKPLISRDSTIGEVVQKYPEVIDTLMGLGVHCVGCGVSEYETLEEGFSGHGMGTEEITSALQKLNEVVTQHASPTLAGKELSLTAFAVEKLKEILSQKNKKALRIAVEAGGCAGYSYSFTLADQPKESDVVLQDVGVPVFVDGSSLQKIKGATVDFVDGLQGAGFKVSNPQMKKSCGCGNSFG